MDKTDQIKLLREELKELKQDWWFNHGNSHSKLSDQLKIITTELRDVHTKLDQLLQNKKVVV